MERKRSALLLFGLLLSAFVAGCGLAPEIKRAAENRSKEISEMAGKIGAMEAELKRKLAGPEGEFLAPYARKENWDGVFAEARGFLSEAESIVQGKAQPLIEKNRRKDGEIVLRHLGDAGVSLRKVREKAQEVPARIEQLVYFKEHAPELAARAEEEIRSLRAEVGEKSELLSEVRQAQAEYPSKKEDLDGRWAAIAGAAGLLSIAEERARVAAGEIERLEPDFDRLGRASDRVHALVTSDIPDAASDLRSKIRELNRSYEKQLVDQKTETKYLVIYGETTWDEWSDWPTEKDRPGGQRYIDKATYDNYAARLDRGENIVVARKSGYERWVDDVEEEWRYSHKYEIMEDGRKRTTDWTEVPEAVYEANEENLGMTIEVKPRGMYASERIEEATPPGYAYVGNAHYGHWRRDERTGGSFWEFYGKYMFLRSLFWGPGYRVYRNDWDTYRGHRRRGETYYGPDGRFGTSGEETRRRYASSTFGRRGGFRGEASVRGAGPAARHRGPRARGK